MIDNSIPVDKVAAVVVSKNNDCQRIFNPGDIITSMSPLPTTQWIGPKKDDLTGKTTGRFTVIGHALWKPNNWRTSTNSVRWVVRCRCGRYQMLTTKAVKKQNPLFACIECLKTRGGL